MPELPEVETVRSILEPLIQGKTIESIRVLRAKNIVSGAPSFVASLTGETFLRVSRKGKYLLFFLSHDKIVVSHLRMEGKYFLKKKTDPLDKFDLLAYDFTDGSSLRYNDVRKFGELYLTTPESLFKVGPVAKLGKEPFVLSEGELHHLFEGKNIPVKEAIMDQTIIAGLGNIYADETLFAARINPKSPAKSLSIDECGVLLQEAGRILRKAIEEGGSTIRSYHPQEGIDGLMQNSLLAYGKENTPCPRCGFPLRKITLGGRGTVYCPLCQKEKNHPFVVGVSGPIASGKSSVSAYLVSQGYALVDADRIVHSLYHEKEVQGKLVSLFGEGILKNGNIARKTLLQLIAKDPEKKKELERLIHPLVYERTLRKIERHKNGKVVLDVPLLFSTPFEDLCDVTIAIFASKEKQEERLRQRGKNVEKSLKMNAAWPRGLAKRKATIVLSGDGSLEDLKAQLSHYPYLFDK